MNDTNPEIKKHFIEMIMKKSGEQRLKMGFSMFNMARQQVISSIKRDKPDANIQEIRKGIFLRFYGQDFSSEELAKILMRLFP